LGKGAWFLKPQQGHSLFFLRYVPCALFGHPTSYRFSCAFFRIKRRMPLFGSIEKHAVDGKNYRLLVSLPRLALTKSCMLTQ
jgi:hypothetical protein